jgi:uncharacterized membrane protein YgdD (TMEM256/DUF423 family)
MPCIGPALSGAGGADPAGSAASGAEEGVEAEHVRAARMLLRWPPSHSSHGCWGPLLFSGDIALRALVGQRLFPMAAASGGPLLIGGWALLAIAALLARMRVK